MIYGLVKDDKVVKLYFGRPQWWFNDGTPVDNEFLVNEGVYQIIQNAPPGHLKQFDRRTAQQDELTIDHEKKEIHGWFIYIERDFWEVKAEERRKFELAVQKFLTEKIDGRDRYTPHHMEAFMGAQHEILSIPVEYRSPAMNELLNKIIAVRDWKLYVMEYWKLKDQELADAEDWNALFSVDLELSSLEHDDPNVELAELIAVLGE